MSATPYPIKTEDELVFSFVSEGPQGRIVKIVKYEMLRPSLYNLAFGDKINNLDLDDEVVSNNSDTSKVLSTVIFTIGLFFEKVPNAFLVIRGSDSARNKLYCRVVKNNFELFSQEFIILGGTKEKPMEPFSDEKIYDWLIISKKS